MTLRRLRSVSPGMSVVCPVDFSEASRTALRYAELIAEHFGARLKVLTINDPLLAEAAAMESSARDVREETVRMLERFRLDGAAALPNRLDVSYEVRVGAPAEEILAASRGAGLIVMSSHGLTGFRKLFFGSTTERVLRQTPLPVLIVPGDQRAPVSLPDALARLNRVLVPVALDDNAPGQIAIARGIAVTAGVPLVLLHVVEPLRTGMPKGDFVLPRVERERRLEAEARVAAMAPELDGRRESLVAIGDPAEEIAKTARDRHTGLIVIALRSPGLPGPHVGSVTYRVLCAAGKLVLALPPAALRARNISRSAKNLAAHKSASLENRRIHSGKA